MKSIIPVVMAGIIAIYGVVVAVLIASDLKAAPEYKLYTGFVHLGAGCCRSFWSSCWLLCWSGWRRRRSGDGSATKTVRGNDSDPYLRRGVGLVWFDCCYLHDFQSLNTLLLLPDVESI